MTLLASTGISVGTGISLYKDWGGYLTFCKNLLPNLGNKNNDNSSSDRKSDDIKNTNTIETLPKATASNVHSNTSELFDVGAEVSILLPHKPVWIYAKVIDVNEHNYQVKYKCYNRFEIVTIPIDSNTIHKKWSGHVLPPSMQSNINYDGPCLLDNCFSTHLHKKKVKEILERYDRPVTITCDSCNRSFGNSNYTYRCTSNAPHDFCSECLISKKNAESVNNPSNNKKNNTIPIKEIKKLIKDEEQCCICMSCFNKNNNILRTSCNHFFHEKCIYMQFQQSIVNSQAYTVKCPACRGDITEFYGKNFC